MPLVIFSYSDPNLKSRRDIIGFNSDVVINTDYNTIELIEKIGFDDILLSLFPISISLEENVRFFHRNIENPNYAFWINRTKAKIYINDNRPDNYWAGDIVYIYYIDGYGSMPYGVGGYGGTRIEDRKLIKVN